MKRKKNNWLCFPSQYIANHFAPLITALITALITVLCTNTSYAECITEYIGTQVLRRRELWF
ncbi:hypothetical protein CPS_2862 [Colwellia psychrerythraea 34H]|uniref:Uncharacterized protein n=1 Tax=Colwellia psychrerythraea (strain 34H / ATCC BAA-681) TaxID=167879 RepID=Q480F2_COLP3|nr:hypothetical protein CPS_2862 [Colwellia psychrerythraea 34H]